MLDVFTIDEGVVVVAKDTWTAFKGKAALLVDWEPGDAATLSSESITKRLRSLEIGPSTLAMQQGEPDNLLDAGSIMSTYTLPFQAHAPLEPMNCTASYEAGKMRIWAPTQSPSRAHDIAVSTTRSTIARSVDKLKAVLFDNPEDSIEINTTLIGGGFGRRLQQDYVSEVTKIAKHIEKPVQLVWTREEDMQHDFYHPLTAHEMRGKLDDRGLPFAWHHVIKGPAVKAGGADNLPYAIPHIRVDVVDIGKILPVGPWRSVQHHYNAFAVEHFFDELARAGDHDPLELRLRLMTKSSRLRRTLELAAEKSGWNYSSGLFGAASAAGFGSYASQVVELEIIGGQIKIRKITCVVDCGIVVNPDIAQAQIEGGIIFGLSAALKSAIHIEGGSVKQHNYHDFPVLKMAETPPIEVHIVESHEDPGGLGEPSVPPIAPAIANALLAYAKKPTRELPIPYNTGGFLR